MEAAAAARAAEGALRSGAQGHEAAREEPLLLRALARAPGARGRRVSPQGWARHQEVDAGPRTGILRQTRVAAVAERSRRSRRRAPEETPRDLALDRTR